MPWDELRLFVVSSTYNSFINRKNLVLNIINALKVG